MSEDTNPYKGLAKLKREGSYTDSEGNEITKEEYKRRKALRPYSRHITLRYEEGGFKPMSSFDVVAKVANDIGWLVSKDEMHEFLAALAHRLLPEKDE